MVSPLLCHLIMIDFGQVTSPLHLLSFLRCSEQAGITPPTRPVVRSERAPAWMAWRGWRARQLLGGMWSLPLVGLFYYGNLLSVSLINVSAFMLKPYYFDNYTFEV